MVTAFLGAKTYGADDVRANIGRIAELVRSFHDEMPKHVSGAGFMFWPFHVIRDYARTLRGRRTAAWRTPCPPISRWPTSWSRRRSRCRSIFGHNDLLPANFLDDGKRLWLIDFEYAGFSTAMFDLAGVASNAGMSADESDELLGRLFRHGAERRDPPLARRHAMRLAAARGDVEHGLRAPSRRARRRLCRLHRRKPGAARRGARRLSQPPTERPAHDLAHACRDRRHRRRHHRLLDGLSSGARPQGRRGAARTGQADLRLDLACGRPGRAIALVGVDHPRAQIFGRPLQAARRRDRACHRLEDDRLPAGLPPTRTAGPNSGGWRRRRKASAWTCI